VRYAGVLGEVMRSGTLAERKAIVRGLTQGITFDPDTGTGVTAFYKVPAVTTVGNAGVGNAGVMTGDAATSGVATQGGEARTKQGRDSCKPRPHLEQ
jgi:hypothetical protein